MKHLSLHRPVPVEKPSSSSRASGSPMARTRCPIAMRSTALAALTAVSTSAAFAQATDPGPRTASALELFPVTVTVTRGVEQRAFDTPASVDVIGADVLRGTGNLQINLSESLQRVPGLVAQNRQNYAQDIQISSRGYGARATFGVRGIKLYSDGIPASGPDGQGQVSHFDLSSAQRVEVLRGPFSALYGNASGGVINVITEQGSKDTGANVSTAFGSDGTRRFGVKVGGAESNFRYLVSASRFETDGDRQHSAAERTGFNAKLNFDPNPDTKLTLILNRVDSPLLQDPLGLTREEYDVDPRAATPVALQFDTRKSVKQTQGGLVIDQRFTASQRAQVTLYAGTRETRQYQAIPVATQTPPTQPGGVIDLARRYRGIDARWIGEGALLARPLTVTAGIAVDESKEDRRGFQNFTGAGAAQLLGVEGRLRRDEANTARSVDPYLQADWAFAERWRVLAGVRHSRVSFDSSDRYVVPGNVDDSGSRSYSATTPALGVVFSATPKVNLYASWGKGFETPTGNELAYRAGGQTGLNLDLQSARSRQWEAGVKAEPFERWRATAAVFEARTSDEIAVLTNTGGRSVFQNVGRTTRRGIEASMAGEFGPGFLTYLAATYLDATYRDGFLTCVAAPCARPIVPVAAGSRIPGIPRASAFAELAWRHAPWGLETGVEWRYTAKVAVDDRNTDFAPSANVFALRASLVQKPGRWTLRESIRIDNVTAKRYAGSVIVNEGNRRFFEPAPRRAWLASLDAKYAF